MHQRDHDAEGLLQAPDALVHHLSGGLQLRQQFTQPFPFNLLFGLLPISDRLFTFWLARVIPILSHVGGSRRSATHQPRQSSPRPWPGTR